MLKSLVIVVTRSLGFAINFLLTYSAESCAQNRKQEKQEKMGARGFSGRWSVVSGQ